MLFKESFITDAGAELLARATAQEGRLVWTRAATSERNTDSLSVNEMNALDEEHFGDLSMTGAVTNVIVNDARNSVSVHCELSNEEADGTARTFGAWAKIDGDESDVLAIVARCGTGVVPVVINPIEQGVVRAFADFSLNISDKQVQAVGVIIGYYATATALQDEIAAREDLAGRVVTCHVAGQSTVGEEQTIYGDKTFTGKVTAGTLVGPLSTPGVTPNDNAATVGSHGAQFSAMYAEDFVGRIPTPTVSASPASNVPDIPVGAIVALLVKNTTVFTSGAAVYCGETIYSDGGELADNSTYTSLSVARLRFESGGAINIMAEQTDSGADLPIGMDFKVIIGGTNAPGVSVDTLRCIAMRIA